MRSPIVGSRTGPAILQAVGCDSSASSHALQVGSQRVAFSEGD